ncbi:hypothetical protein MRX96_047185 [Rhipicephalus microplus]
MQALPLVSGGDTGKVAAATPVRASGDSTATPEVTGKATESSAAHEADELRCLNEHQHEKSGAPSSNSVAAPKRPHPQARNGGAETTVSGAEEPPVKTAQGRQPSLRPRPNLTADKRVNVENVGQSANGKIREKKDPVATLDFTNDYKPTDMHFLEASKASPSAKQAHESTGKATSNPNGCGQPRPIRSISSTCTYRPRLNLGARILAVAPPPPAPMYC